MSIFIASNPFRSAGGVVDSIPSGVIVMWSGTVNNIPDGWALCNGSNGTPDLRGRFVLGAGGSYSVSTKGGAEVVTLTEAQMPTHGHIYSTFQTSAKTTTSTSSSAVYFANSNTSSNGTATAGSSQPHENMPPYYALCYIMKL